MRVVRARGLAGARGARGTVVVIDVLRAFTTAAWAFAAGARALELVAEPAEALARKAVDPSLVLVGEVGGRPIAGFDHGNSPERMRALDLRGQSVLLRSSSGVQGVFAVQATAAHILLGSFATAAATVRRVRALGHDVTLLAMGAGGAAQGLDGPEDDACAELFAARIEERAVDVAALLELARSGPAAQAALDPAIDWITRGDLELALEVDRFDFALAAETVDARIVVRRS